MLFSSRKILLIDSIGAIISAMLLGIVLPELQQYIGMPEGILFLLSLTACLFAIYSFASYVLVKNNWRQSVAVVGVANFLYCCLTVYFIAHYYHRLTTPGIIYFIIDVTIVLSIAIVELNLVFNLLNRSRQ